MLLIQIAVTAFIVYFVSRSRLAAALSPLAILTGRTKAFPTVTALIVEASYWTAVIAALAAVWTFRT